VIEGLRDWQAALGRSLAEPPPQLLVAARVDAGFGASRTLLQRFAAENGSRLLETSARDGSGCPELIAAIAATIPWERLPRHTSPRLFRRIKAEILRLRDGTGEALLTYKDLGTAATNINHYKTLVIHRHRLENSNVDKPRLFHTSNDVDNNPCFIERSFDENGSILGFPNRARRYGHDIGVVNGRDFDQTSER
jgi:hypothetical protein